MTRPISEDLRRRILKVRETTGKTYEELAEQFQVGRATVNRLLRLNRETGGLQPRPRGGGMPKRVPDEQLPRVKGVVDAHPDATLAELAVMVSRELGRSVSRPTMGRMMVRLRLLSKEEGTGSQRARPARRAAKARRVPGGHRDG
ncbi:helix-turn-helix domain-containing protein [Myxococcus sp. AB025B]|uniref:helix-turn-helix domain-containing protein n=1 Tax=Myxococcus sp. AB025B TaxID=2562794 RepID=UPI0011429566